MFCPSWKPIEEETRQTWKKVHWLLCKKFEIECEDKWFSHQPEPVLENDKCKILWDFAIQTDKEIEHRNPDIVVIDKEKRECKIIDIELPGNQNIKVKELEKITKFQDLRLQVQKLWNVKATVIPIVVGALGTVSEELENHLKTIGIPIVISCLQKAALLGKTFILRRVLSDVKAFFSPRCGDVIPNKNNNDNNNCGRKAK